MNNINDKIDNGDSNSNENTNNNIVLNIDGVEFDCKSQPILIKNNIISDKNTKSENDILLNIDDYSDNIKNPSLVKRYTYSDGSKIHLNDDNTKLGSDDINQKNDNCLNPLLIQNQNYSENSVNNMKKLSNDNEDYVNNDVVSSINDFKQNINTEATRPNFRKNLTFAENNVRNSLLLERIFSKRYSVDESSMRAYKSVHSINSVNKIKKDNMSSILENSNWDVKDDDSNESQTSLLKCSTSNIKNKLSNSYIRLKLDPKVVDVIRSKSNIDNIFENNNNNNDNNDNNNDMAYDSNDNLDEINKSDLSVQPILRRRSRTGSILITGIKSGSPETIVTSTSHGKELTVPSLPYYYQLSMSENNTYSTEELCENQRKNSGIL
ncbi:hypothetical protein PIROE2DRAFT_5843 [Piromyces sp. E2]|nr:hypothetical protein PIROE2DRAFT_5843 [Piromyces sp. E2]|eukprot:OUM66862.1 hypothetical protein PIROE2DRAFT_5843 [Piromyces sp. E2]